MNKRIRLILFLIVSCVAGLILLQGYWSYSAFDQADKSFRSDINAALQQAIDEEIEIQHKQILKKYASWLNDTNLIVIGTRYHKFNHTTSYTIADKHPPFKDGRKPFNMGFGSISDNKKIDSITPELKKKFIELFTSHVIKEDIKKHASSYYTERLGDSLALVLQNNRVNMAELTRLYRKALASYDIKTDFRLDTGLKPGPGIAKMTFNTKSLKAGVSLNIHVQAAFGNPELIVLTRMKWVLLSSLLLISITILCFAYTAKTLLSQEKLGLIKDDFVNNMTHELKTPVATIAVAAEAIQTFKLSKDSADDYLGIIRNQAGNLSYLIDKILNHALKEENGFFLTLEKISLRSFLEKSLSQYQPHLQINDACVELITDGSQPFIMGDAVHLTNVFINLLENAVKYGSLSR